MRTPKLYFKSDSDELCFTIEQHKEQMWDESEKERKVYRAKTERGLGFFYCREYSEVGETKESCGSGNCGGYSARNGKSGICKHHGFLYYKTDESKILRLKD
jgi:hypothetical protein